MDKSIKKTIQVLPAQTLEALNPSKNITEIRTLKPHTKQLMTLMLLTTVVAFVLSKDFSLLGWIGLTTGIATVMNLILVDQGRFTNYSWGLLACVVWLIVALHNRLIGDIASQSFYFIMQFVGISVWHRQLDNQGEHTELESKKLTVLQAIFWLVVAIATYGIVLFTSSKLNGTQIFLDATLLPLGIVGQILMTYGYRSQWVAWIALDIVNVIIWFNQLNAGGIAAASMFVLQIVMLLNAFYGAYLWFKPTEGGEVHD